MDDSDLSFTPPYRTLAPADCVTMTDVRAGVDEIDRMLVVLLARRQGYMDAAARIKPSRAVVRDEARIQQVLDNVAANGARAGLSWDIAEPVWRTLMERCIAHEFMVYDQLKPSQTDPEQKPAEGARGPRRPTTDAEPNVRRRQDYRRPPGPL